MTVYYTLHFDCGNVFTATDDDFLLNFTIGGQGLSREGRLWKKFTETHLFGGKTTNAPVQLRCTGALVEVRFALSNREFGPFWLLDMETIPILDDRRICSSAILH
jgi:hypothetical protein